MGYPTVDYKPHYFPVNSYANNLSKFTKKNIEHSNTQWLIYIYNGGTPQHNPPKTEWTIQSRSDLYWTFLIVGGREVVLGQYHSKPTFFTFNIFFLFFCMKISYDLGLNTLATIKEI